MTKKGPTPKYTAEMIRKKVAAKKFTKRSQLKNYNNPMYQAAYRLKLLDELFGPTALGTRKEAKSSRVNIAAQKAKAKIVNTDIDDKDMTFSFDVSLQQLSATEAEKAMALFRSFNA